MCRPHAPLICALCAFSMLLGGCGSGGGGHTAQLSAALATYSDHPERETFAAVPPGDTFALGETIDVFYDLTNPGDQPIAVSSGDAIIATLVITSDASGERVFPRPTGALLPTTLDFAAHERKELELIWDQSTIAGPPAPAGTYTVTATSPVAGVATISQKIFLGGAVARR